MNVDSFKWHEGRSLTNEALVKIPVKLNVYYKIKAINGGVGSEKLGESFQKCYEYSSSGHGYEHLTLFIFRNNSPNYIRYFKNIDECIKAISYFEYELDKDTGEKSVSYHLDKIKQLCKSYELGDLLSVIKKINK